MKKIKIKGNDYVMVHERVKEFHNLFPNGSMKTEVVELTDARFITITTVVPDVKVPERCFTGIACELANDESALENCETSSCGRALGFLNIGIDTSIASYEEVSNAISKQKSKPIKQALKEQAKTVQAIHDLVDPMKNVKEVFGEDNVKPYDTETDDVITFGKHKGVKWSDVPENYLEWLAKNNEKYSDKATAELAKKHNGVVSRPNKASGGMSDVAHEEETGIPM